MVCGAVSVVSAGQVSEAVRARVRVQSRDRCGYCQSQQHCVLGPLEIDHIVPMAQGGTNQEENLWLACRLASARGHTSLTSGQ